VKDVFIATSMSLSLRQALISKTDFDHFRFFSLEEVIKDSELASKCEVLWVNLFPIVNKDLVTLFPNLKFIATATTGVTHIDSVVTNERGIRIISLQGEREFLSEITSTPEFAWGLMLSVWRKINLASQNYLYEVSIREQYSSRQLKGLTLGLIGYGRIAKNLAKYGDVFGMSVIYFDPYLEIVDSNHNRRSCASLDEVLISSDVTIICASVLEKDKVNHPLINSANISRLKKNSIIVNVSRGVLVDENSLASALRCGNLFGVGVDVLTREDQVSPLKKRSPLELARDEGFNAVITPHIGGMCDDALLKCTIKIASKVVSQLK
jgi:D-3-phosphoglycerate dehydrogenase